VLTRVAPEIGVLWSVEQQKHAAHWHASVHFFLRFSFTRLVSLPAVSCVVPAAVVGIRVLSTRHNGRGCSAYSQAQESQQN
jgi:hypothetical protein